MYSRIRAPLAATLIFALVTLPLNATPAQPLGIVFHVSNAQLNGVALVDGTTVYAGDQLTTGPSGGMIVRSGSSQIYLLDSSSLTAGGVLGRIRLQLGRGVVVINAHGAPAFTIDTQIATLRPSKAEDILLQVSVVNPTEMLVKAVRGEMIVEGAGESKTLAEGKAYKVMLSDQEQESKNADVKRPRKRRRALLIILMGSAEAAGLAAVMIGGGLKLQAVSPSVP